MKPNVVIWGAAGHARVVADIVRLVGEYQIVGFLDDVSPSRTGTEFCDSVVLGGKEQLCNLLEKGVTYIIVAIGDCRSRLCLAAIAEEHGFHPVTAVHPHATIASNVPIGDGTVIMAGAVINPGAYIAKHAVVNTCASVDHDSIILDGTHISPGARLAGNVQVGRATWIGIGATVINDVKIGAEAIIGAGSVVVCDIPDRVLAYGVPARVIKRIVNDDQDLPQRSRNSRRSPGIS